MALSTPNDESATPKGGIAVLCLYVASAAMLLAITAELVLRSTPPPRLGSWDGRDVAAAVWALAGAVGGGLALLGARELRRDRERGRTLARAAVVLAAVAAAPLVSWSATAALSRGRFVAAGYWATVAGIVVLGLCVQRQRAASAQGFGSPARPPARRALTLLASSALVVLLAEGAIDAAVYRELGYVPDGRHVVQLAGVWIRNTLVVTALVALLVGATGRSLFALGAVAATCFAAAGANAIKLSHLSAPLHPNDVFLWRELGRMAPEYVGDVGFAVAGAFGAAAIAGAVLLWRREAVAWTWAARAGWLLAGGAALAVTWSAASERQGRVAWDARSDSLARGLAVYLLEETAQALQDSDQAAEHGAPGTPAESAQAILRRRAGSDAPSRGEVGAAPAASAAQGPDVIVVMVESLWDPVTAGFCFDDDPLPFLRSLEGRGAAVSPSFGSQSANAEFELLTGWSLALLPRSSLAYRQYVSRPLPALPRVFAEAGWRTLGLHVDPPSYFDRPRCYPLLGFEELRFLGEEGGHAQTPDGRWVSDEGVVDAICASLAGPRPQFVFAFTNATHAPYTRARWPGPGPRLTTGSGRRLAAPARETLEAYARAIRSTDAALARLVGQLKASQRAAVLVVVGDHLPPFPGPNGVWQAVRDEGGTELEQTLARHTVPLWQWTSFDAEPATRLRSMNWLGVELLALAGIEPPALWRALASVRDELPVASRVVQRDGGELRACDEALGAGLTALADYAALQRDTLFGAARPD